MFVNCKLLLLFLCGFALISANNVFSIEYIKNLEKILENTIDIYTLLNTVINVWAQASKQNLLIK